ncbi:MAG: SEC-C domain-containing protein [Gemmatimonadaceae bacterium]
MSHPPPSRNDPCPCGSGRKYKRCCMEREQPLPFADRPLRLVDGGPSKDSRIFDPALRPLLSDDWELEAVPFPARYADDPAARPVAVLVGSGPLVVHCKTLRTAPAEPDELARVLAHEVDVAIGAAQRAPRRIDVRHASIADALRPLLQTRGITVRGVGSLTNLREAAQSLCSHLAGKEDAPMASLPETWAGWGLPRDSVARLFRAAAAYYRARPWEQVADDRPIVAALADGAEWHASILGNAGQEFGLALHSDREDLELLYGNTDPKRALLEMRGMVLSVTFSAKDDLPPRMRREISASGWEIAGSAAHPLLMVMGTPGGGVRHSQAAEVIALLRAVPRFVAAMQGDISRGGKPSERWTDAETGAVLSFDSSSRAAPEAFGTNPSI